MLPGSCGMIIQYSWPMEGMTQLKVLREAGAKEAHSVEWLNEVSGMLRNMGC